MMEKRLKYGWGSRRFEMFKTLKIYIELSNKVSDLNININFFGQSTLK